MTKSFSAQMRGITILLFFLSLLPYSNAQITMSPESGSFGLLVGAVRSNLGQVLPASSGVTQTYHQGYEIGLKNEMYRGQWLRGNMYASFIQLGATEFIQTEAGWETANVDLKAVKVALTPLLGKVGSDMFHGYAGGGVFGTYFFDEYIGGAATTGNYWNESETLEQIDFGLNLVAGFHAWNFDLEFHANFGNLDLAERPDGTMAKQKFFGLQLAYMFIDRNVTRRSCRDKKN